MKQYLLNNIPVALVISRLKRLEWDYNFSKGLKTDYILYVLGTDLINGKQCVFSILTSSNNLEAVENFLYDLEVDYSYVGFSQIDFSNHKEDENYFDMFIEGILAIKNKESVDIMGNSLSNEFDDFKYKDRYVGCGFAHHLTDYNSFKIICRKFGFNPKKSFNSKKLCT